MLMESLLFSSRRESIYRFLTQKGLRGLILKCPRAMTVALWSMAGTSVTSCTELVGSIRIQKSSTLGLYWGLCRVPEHLVWVRELIPLTWFCLLAPGLSLLLESFCCWALYPVTLSQCPFLDRTLYFFITPDSFSAEIFLQIFFKQGGLWLQLVSRWKNWKHYIATLKQIILPHGIITLIWKFPQAAICH